MSVISTKSNSILYCYSINKVKYLCVPPKMSSQAITCYPLFIKCIMVAIAPQPLEKDIA